MQPVTAENPFHMITMDFLELPLTASGNRYCLVVSDYFTRWPEAFALPDQKAITVARTIVTGTVCRHGVPEVILSDQGRSFDNEVVKALCQMLNVKKVRTSPYHPQCDGLVERLNRTLLPMLSTFVADKRDTWDQHLDQILFAYRSSTQASTGYTPFELLYGHKPVERTDHEFSLPRLARYGGAREYLQATRGRQRLAKELASDCVSAAQARQADNCPLVQRHKYTVGDHVFLHDPASHHGPGYKLARPWFGQFRVEDLLGLTNVRVKRCDKGSNSTVVHYNRLKPDFSRKDYDSSIPTSHLDTPEAGKNHDAPRRRVLKAVEIQQWKPG